MITLRLNTIPWDPLPHQQIEGVQLCLEGYLFGEGEMPALTIPCGTKEDIEEEFERVVTAIRKKKQEAIALLATPPKRRSSNSPMKKTPNKAPEPTTMAVTSRAPSSTSRARHGRGSS